MFTGKIIYPFIKLVNPPTVLTPPVSVAWFLCLFWIIASEKGNKCPNFDNYQKDPSNFPPKMLRSHQMETQFTQLLFTLTAIWRDRPILAQMKLSMSSCYPNVDILLAVIPSSTAVVPSNPKMLKMHDNGCFLRQTFKLGERCTMNNGDGECALHLHQPLSGPYPSPPLWPHRAAASSHP